MKLQSLAATTFLSKALAETKMVMNDISNKVVVNGNGRRMIEFFSGQGKAEKDMGDAPLPPALFPVAKAFWHN